MRYVDERCVACNCVTATPRFRHGKWYCRDCDPINNAPPYQDSLVTVMGAFAAPKQRAVVCKYGHLAVREGDRFLWNTHRWFVVGFADDGGVQVRFQGEPDVAVLPEEYVAELIHQSDLMPYGVP